MQLDSISVQKATKFVVLSAVLSEWARVVCGQTVVVSNPATGCMHPFTERLTMLAVASHSEGNQERRTVGIVCCLCLLAVLTAFLSPAHTGPYTTVRGPVTAFKSLQNLQCLELSILLAALHVRGLKPAVLPPDLMNRWFSR